MSASASGRSFASTSASSNSAKTASICKFCRRSQQCPNPFADRSRYPGEFLPWRREQGRECRSCCNYIKVARLDRNALDQSLQDPGEQAAFQVQISKYENYVNNPGQPHGMGARQDAGMSWKRARVCQTKSSKVQTKVCMGNMWPCAAYTAKFKQDPDPKKIVTIQHIHGACLHGHRSGSLLRNGHRGDRAFIHRGEGGRLGDHLR